jgi:hypothetical protein
MDQAGPRLLKAAGKPASLVAEASYRSVRDAIEREEGA